MSVDMRTVAICGLCGILTLVGPMTIIPIANSLLYKRTQLDANQTMRNDRYHQEKMHTEYVSNNALHGIETGWKFSRFGEIIQLSQITPESVGLFRITVSPREVQIFERGSRLMQRKVDSEITDRLGRWIFYSKNSTFAVLSDSAFGMIFSADSSWEWREPSLSQYRIVGTGYSENGTVGLLTSNFPINEQVKYIALLLSDDSILAHAIEFPVPPTEVAITDQFIVAWTKDTHVGKGDNGTLTVFKVVADSVSVSLRQLWETECGREFFLQVRSSTVLVNEFGFFRISTDQRAKLGLLEFTSTTSRESKLDVDWQLKLPKIDGSIRVFSSPKGKSIVVIGESDRELLVYSIDPGRQELRHCLVIKPTGLVLATSIQVAWHSESEFAVTWNDHIPHDFGKPNFYE